MRIHSLRQGIDLADRTDGSFFRRPAIGRQIRRRMPLGQGRESPGAADRPQSRPVELHCSRAKRPMCPPASPASGRRHGSAASPADGARRRPCGTGRSRMCRIAVERLGEYRQRAARSGPARDSHGGARSRGVHAPHSPQSSRRQTQPWRRRRRPMKPKPISPVPSRASEPGSGAATGSATSVIRTLTFPLTLSEL